MCIIINPFHPDLGSSVMRAQRTPDRRTDVLFIWSKKNLDKFCTTILLEFKSNLQHSIALLYIALRLNSFHSVMGIMYVMVSGNKPIYNNSFV